MSPAPDEFPDFDSMTPEEQMAWLESLARRQGANVDEFVTAADQDIPIPEDVEIDEPGYVPYSISEGGRMERREEPTPEPGDTDRFETEQPDAEAVPAGDEAFEEDTGADFPPVLEDIEFQADAFGAAPAMNDPDDPSESNIADLEEEAADDILSDADLADPMTWLDSLSAHPEGAEADFLAEIERAASAGEFNLQWPEEDRTSDELPTVLEDRGPALDLGSLEDLELDGFEELNLEEILGQAGSGEPMKQAGTLAGDDSDSWLESLAVRQGSSAEEYLPEELDFTEDDEAPEVESESSPAGDESALRASVAAEADDDQTAEDEELQAAAAWPAEDMLGGADPMTWLETLARRQGANPEELTTEADLEIPELPEDTVVDEPGYTEYSPFGILPPHREESARAESVDFVAETRPEAEPQASAELEALGQSLGWLSEMTGEPSDELSTWLAVEDTFVERDLRADDDGADFSRAATAAEGDPLADMRDEEIEQALLRGELTGEQELAWLQHTAREQAAAREEDLSAEEPEVIEPAEPGDLPPWLQQMRAADAEDADIDAVADTGASAAAWLGDQAAEQAEPGRDAETLWSDTGPGPEALALDQLGISETELAAFLEGEIGTDEAQGLAEAFGEGEPLEPALAEAAPVEMPDWLVEADDEGASDGRFPEWLAQTEQEIPAPVEEVPDWLNELRADDAGQEPAASAASALPPEPEFSVPPREPMIPDSELFATYRQRLEEEPDDHASRLALARTLRTHGEVAPSLDHYETLVESAQLLEDVSNDLASLVDEQPKQSRVRRLLGDTFMRRGKLQDALDAYRAALEQL